MHRKIRYKIGWPIHPRILKILPLLQKNEWLSITKLCKLMHEKDRLKVMRACAYLNTQKLITHRWIQVGDGKGIPGVESEYSLTPMIKTLERRNEA